MKKVQGLFSFGLRISSCYFKNWYNYEQQKPFEINANWYK